MTESTPLDPAIVVDAVRTMIERVHYPGETCYPSVLFNVLRHLGEDPPPWTREHYETIRNQQATKLTRLKDKTLGKIDRELIDGRLHFLQTNGDSLRPSTTADLANPAKSPGDLLFREVENDVQLRKRLAHNYCLTYPERMWLLTQFPAQGLAKKEVLDRYRSKFIFHKKVNPVIADNAFNEFGVLDLLDRLPDKRVRISSHVPSPVYAVVAIEAFLAVSDGDLSKSLDIHAVENEFGLVFGKAEKKGQKRLLGPWRTKLGTQTEAMRGESGNTRIRLHPDGFCHLVACGMVDPKHAATTLRRIGADKELGELRGLMERLVLKEDDRPANAEPYLAHFS